MTFVLVFCAAVAHLSASPATTNDMNVRADARRTCWSLILAVEGGQFRDTVGKSFDVSIGLDRNSQPDRQMQNLQTMALRS